MTGFIFKRGPSFQTWPWYLKKKISNPSKLGTDQKLSVQAKFSSVLTEAPSMIVPRLSSSRSVREVIDGVKMVQVWGNIKRSRETRGKELLDANVINSADLYGWLKPKMELKPPIIDSGLSSYSFLQTLLHSINAGSDGLLFLDGLEITNLNRPHDRLFDWFFHPTLVLKEQIQAIQLEECEMKFLEKSVLFGNHIERLKAWENGSMIPQYALKAAKIEGISRRLIGIGRSVSKLPTYRMKFPADHLLYSKGRFRCCFCTKHWLN